MTVLEQRYMEAMTSQASRIADGLEQPVELKKAELRPPKGGKTESESRNPQE